MPDGTPTKPLLSLSTFDGKSLDGLEFCGKVYDLFDQVRSEPGGIAKLRSRPTRLEKRLVEELIPISRYLQARYREGRRIKITWFSGSQPFEAVLRFSGDLVKEGFAPEELFLEVTTSVHPNEYLTRELLNQHRGYFGVEGVSRDKRTRAIVSKPHVHSQSEIAKVLAGQITRAIEKKTSKDYPTQTVLVVSCIANGLVLPEEWDAAITRVAESQIPLPFREVFLVETLMGHSKTLYCGRSVDRQPTISS